MTQITLTAIVQREDDLYVAECRDIGTVSQGYTIEEAIANLKEATELYLEEFPAKQRPPARSRESSSRPELMRTNCFDGWWA